MRYGLVMEPIFAEGSMSKTISRAVAAAILVAASGPTLALAQDKPQAAAPSAAGRFTLQKVEGGVVRMDNETGEMSLCHADGQSLACKPATDDGKRLQARIDDLEKRVATLESEAKGGNLLSKALPTDKDLDQAMNVFERLVRRVFGMANDLNREFQSQPKEEGGTAGPPQKT